MTDATDLEARRKTRKRSLSQTRRETKAASEVVENKNLKGHTPADLSNSDGFTSQSISKIERGDRTQAPSPRQGDRLSELKRTPKQVGGTSRPRHELKPLPEGLTWPRPRVAHVPDDERQDDDYDKSPEFNGWGGLARYLKRVWKPLIPYIDMPTMREHWPAAAVAIDRQRLKLPTNLLPAVEREVTDRAAAAIPNRGDRPARLEWALNKRAYRARKRLEN